MPLVRAVEGLVLQVTFLVLLIFIVFDDLRKERTLLGTRQLRHYEKALGCATKRLNFVGKDPEKMKCLREVSQN